jgi:hypothetical protein
MPRRLSLAAVLLALAVAVPPSLAAVPAVPASETAPATQVSDARWQNLLERLGDDNFTTRETAQQELEQITWHDLPTLRQLADADRDPEVKARLAARVAAIDEQLMTNPPGPTVEFKDAAIQEVVAKLSAAMGTKLDVWPPNGRGSDVFTLSAREMPFWEIILALSRQHGLTVQDMGGQLRLMTQVGPSWRNAVMSGPMVILPQSITRQRNSNLQADKGDELSEESLTLNCQVGIDPRLRVLRNAQPAFTSIVDDSGNNLLPPNNNDPPLWDVGGRSMALQSFSTALLLSEKKGTRIVSARGSAHYVLLVAEQVVEIPAAEKKEGQSFDIGGYSVKITAFTVQKDSVNMTLTLTRTANAPDGGPALVIGPPGLAMRINDANSQPGVQVMVSDSTGKTMMNTTLRGNMGAGMGGSYTPPFKLHLSLPTKTKDVTYPFELKDLPLP